MRRYMRVLLVLLPCVAWVVRPLAAQITQPFNNDPFIVVTPSAPVAPVTATIDVFNQCADPRGPSLLKPGVSNVVSGAVPVPLVLAAKLTSGEQLCAIETFSGAGAPAAVQFQAIVASARPAAPPAPVATVTIEPAAAPQQFVLVDAVAPATGQTATLDVFPACPVLGGPALVSILAPAQQKSVPASGGTVTLLLANPLHQSDPLCAVETFAVPAATKVSVLINASATATAAAPVAPPTTPTSDQLDAQDKAIRIAEMDCTKKRDAFCLNSINYTDFMNAVARAVNANVPPAAGQTWLSDYTRRLHWLVSTIYYRHDCGKPPAAVAAGQPVCTQQQTSNFAFSLPGDLTGNITHTRIMAGIDVSAASSADPAAKFLGEFDVDIPLPGRKTTSQIGANDWIWGYARVSSIAQPGAVGMASNAPTYVQALTSSTPNTIVQSFEATGGYEFRFRETDTHGWARRPYIISGILGGGIITPISAAQLGTNPPIYIATTALQQYYASVATQHPGNSTDKTNAANIAAACPTAPAGGTATTCYIAEYPSARERFFHNYGIGLRIKHYYFNDWDESFIFPAIFDITVGQNDYVTAGYLRRFIIHFGGSTPIKQFPGLYVYAAFDLVLEKNNTPDQQFVLQPAASTVTSASANVANIFVGQADRDRYRFGITYDLDSLIKKFNPPKQ